MVPDSITEEIREIRHRLTAQFDNDIYRIGADIRRRQSESGRTYIRLPRRRPAVTTTLNQTMHRSGSGEVLGDGGSTPAGRLLVHVPPINS